MSKPLVTFLPTIPEFSIIAQNFQKIDYVDSFQLNKAITETIDAIANKVFIIPNWVKALMKVRNSIVQLFGLKTEKDIKQEKLDYYPIGSSIIGFPVVARSSDEIVMQLDDIHLSFKVSILADRTKNLVALTTIVKFNNALGKVYFLPVKPFHKRIITALLKNYAKQTT